jgi:uncharacterized protein
MRSAVVVDSGPLIALFDRDDAYHNQVLGFFKKHPSLKLLTTWAVINETSALLGSRVGKPAEIDFLVWIERGGMSLISQDASALAKIRLLIEKYQDLPLDFADASVAALAEDSGLTQVLTVDRDFEVYRDSRGQRLKNLLTLRPVRTR